MSEIDPKDLGDPVYKYDQVITKNDLAHMVLYYAKAEEILVFMEDRNGAEHCCTAHKTVESMIKWIDDGKPILVEKRDGEED